MQWPVSIRYPIAKGYCVWFRTEPVIITNFSNIVRGNRTSLLYCGFPGNLKNSAAMVIVFRRNHQPLLQMARHCLIRRGSGYAVFSGSPMGGEKVM